MLSSPGLKRPAANDTSALDTVVMPAFAGMMVSMIQLAIVI
ncbi:hypothetical protein [Aquicella lusitana]|nr:hypothetical protein [Aquicella lusitana]